MTNLEARALRALAALSPLPAVEVGRKVWGDRRRGPIVAPHGGGDYAAQMLLGRLRKHGLVRTTIDSWAGCSLWELTEKGREAVPRCPECGSLDHVAETCDMQG